MIVVSHPEHAAGKADEIDGIDIFVGDGCGQLPVEFGENLASDLGIQCDHFGARLHGSIEATPHHFGVVECGSFHASLHPVVGASDGRGHPALGQEVNPRRGGAILRAVFDAARALDDHWIGDLIGAVSLFAGAWLLLVLGYGMGWQ